MGQINPFVDLTGNRTDLEVLNQTVSSLMDEFNNTQQIGNKQISTYSDGASSRYQIGYQTNGYGTNKNIGIKVSKIGKEVTTAPDSDLSYKDDFSTITYFDATNPRILIGLLPDGTYGIAISKPGIDVRTAFS